jgi:hypothetical protein
MDYNKYIKYKHKYLKLKNQHGGKIPFVTLDDNITKDYFPFDNNNFNYYYNDYLLIDNKKEIDYLLNEKFELDKFVISHNNNYNEKNIINNNNIYKLADQQINISSKKLPFHLCLLSKYKILDNLYKKHINIDIDKSKIIWDPIEQETQEKIITRINEKEKIIQEELDQALKQKELLENYLESKVIEVQNELNEIEKQLKIEKQFIDSQ